MTDFPARLAAVAAAVEERLSAALAGEAMPGLAAQERLVAAMRHGALGGGKRLRPFLVVETAAVLGGEDLSAGALEAGAALEALHCYSLVHDDLPAMDDDDLRRGRPTVHVAYDEATAILAGDGLLTLAFAMLARPSVHPDPAVRIALVGLLAEAAGARGMVGGQALDLAGADGAPGEAEIARMQALKTGRLLSAAVAMGAALAGAGADERARLVVYAEALGLAFQLADDLLDLEGSAEDVGKRTGKDAGRGKATLPALHGAAAARRRLAELVDEAEAALAPFGPAADGLRAAARFVADRRS